jgi:hypothetical protein
MPSRNVETILARLEALPAAERERAGLGAVIGQGREGVVCDAGGGRVAKLVLGAEEPRMAALVGRLGLRHAVRVVEVVKYEPFYAIRMERLRPLSPAQERVLRSAGFQSLLDMAQYGAEDPAKIAQASRGLSGASLSLVEQSLAMGRELLRHGLSYGDSQLDNVMRDARGTLKLVDLSSLERDGDDSD